MIITDFILTVRGPVTVVTGVGLTIGVMALMLWLDREIFGHRR